MKIRVRKSQVLPFEAKDDHQRVMYFDIRNRVCLRSRVTVAMFDAAVEANITSDGDWINAAMLVERKTT